MLTIVCEAPGKLAATVRPPPQRRDDEVLVAIKRIGVCGTDLHIFAGNQPYLAYPRVMGHELAAVVVAAPETASVKPGDAVAVLPYLACGTCRACRDRKPNCCARLQVLGVHRDGGMTGLLSLPVANVLAADGLTLDEAAMVEFLAIGAHAVRRAALRADRRVLVVGAGPIGIAAALFAAETGASVTMLDTRADRLAFCTRHLPVAGVVQVGDNDTAALAALSDEWFDVVFDATGNPRAMERGFSFVAQGGTYVLVSIVAGPISFSDPEFHRRETTLLGSRNATAEDFDTVMAAMRAGRVPVAALGTHRLGLADVPHRFAELADPAAGVVKALIEV